MRNLKRALSLTLASVMLLGMMVVGSSAAKGYDDVSETDNVEAIEVLQAIEVMVGDDRGFGPERPVNRAEMAVVMGKLLSLDYNYYSTSCPFNDVYDWAQGWVGACAANGIVSGRGDGIYDPGATVTAVEAASMLMRALGYFKYSNDYADGFEVSTVRQGTIIGIFDGVGSSATEPMTRNQVAQMVLNALQSAVVEPDGNTINLTTPDGTVYTGKVNYVSVTSQKAFAHAISWIEATSVGSQNDGWIVELGERLYDGKLQLDEDIDVFGRPSRKWEYDGKAIGTYAKKELLDKEYVGKVTGKDLFDQLGSSTIKDYDVYCFVDGVYTDGEGAQAALDGVTGAYFNYLDMNKNNKAAVGRTGTGVLTQVYVDHDKDEVYVVVINTYLAIADKDYDEKKEEAKITAYSIKKDGGINEYVKVPQPTSADESFTLAVEDFAKAADIKKGDALLVTVADGEVQSFKAAEVLAGVTISAFSKNSSATVDGTKYDYTTTAAYNYDDLKDWTNINITNLKDRTYNVYLDAYGNLIGVKEVDAAKNYMFITGIDMNSSNRVNQTADASAIFIDGTMDSIKINMTKSALDTSGDDPDSILNTWCTYTKNGDVYTVKEVTKVNPVTGDKRPDVNNDTGLAQYNGGGAPTMKIDAKNYRLKGSPLAAGTTFSSVYGDKDTVYITAKLGELYRGDNAGDNWGIIKDVASVTTGIANANIDVWTASQAATKANDDNRKILGTPAEAKTSQGVYTLYDDKGIIIAAVVIGEDAGTAKDLVYVTSADLSLESDNGGNSNRAAGDGLWTWTRDVVRDGEKVTLTEVGEESSYLKSMVRYRWYQIRTNAAGDVIAAEEASVAFKDSASSKFVKEYSAINSTVETNGVDTVLYLTAGGPNGNATNGFGAGNLLKVEGNNTLAVTNQVGSGIHFRDDVHVVLQYYDRNAKAEDILTGDGIDDLEDMVDIVNNYSTGTPNRGNASYYVSALIEDGFATTIVIYDSYNNYVRPGGNVNDGIYTLTLGNAFDKAEVYVDNILREDGEVKMTNAGKTMVFSGIAAGAEVYIQMPNSATVETTSYKVNGVDVYQYAAGKVVAIPDMTNDVTLTGLKTAAAAEDEKTYTLHFDSSIEVGKFYEDTSGNGSAWAEVTPISKNPTAGEYTFTVGQNVVAVDVKTTVADHVFMSSDANANVITTDAGNWSADHDSAAKKFVFSAAANKDMWVHEAVYVETDSTAHGIGYTGNTLNASRALFVAANTTTGFFDMPSAAGSITGILAANTLTGTNVAGGLTVEGDDVVLYGAYKLTLNDVAAKVHATDTTDAAAITVNATTYVKSGAKVAAVAVSGKPQNVVDGTGAVVNAEKTAGTNDLNWTAKTKVSVGSGKADVIVYEADKITVVARDTVKQDAYVSPNAKLFANANGQTMKINNVTKAECDADATKTPAGVEWVTESTANITVGVADLTFSY